MKKFIKGFLITLLACVSALCFIACNDNEQVQQQDGEAVPDVVFYHDEYEGIIGTYSIYDNIKSLTKNINHVSSITVSFAVKHEGQNVEVTDGNFIANSLGDYNVTVVAKSSAGLSSEKTYKLVIIEDTTAPEITLKGLNSQNEVSLKVDRDINLSDYYFVSDKYSLDNVSVNHVVTFDGTPVNVSNDGIIHLAETGEYIVKVIASKENGKSCEKQFTIKCTESYPELRLNGSTSKGGGRSVAAVYDTTSLGFYEGDQIKVTLRIKFFIFSSTDNDPRIYVQEGKVLCGKSANIEKYPYLDVAYDDVREMRDDYKEISFTCEVVKAGEKEKVFRQDNLYYYYMEEGEGVHFCFYDAGSISNYAMIEIVSIEEYNGLILKNEVAACYEVSTDVNGEQLVDGDVVSVKANVMTNVSDWGSSTRVYGAKTPIIGATSSNTSIYNEKTEVEFEMIYKTATSTDEFRSGFSMLEGKTGLHFMLYNAQDKFLKLEILSVEKLGPGAIITGNGAFGIPLTKDDNGKSLVAGDTVRATIKYKTTMSSNDSALWVYDTNATSANGYKALRICGYFAETKYVPDESGYMTLTLEVAISPTGAVMTYPDDSKATLPVTGINFLQRAFNTGVVGEVVLLSVEKIGAKTTITGNGAFGIALTQDDSGNALVAGDVVKATIKYKTTMISNDSALWLYDFSPANTTANGSVVRVCGYHGNFKYEPDNSGYMLLTVYMTITAAGTELTYPSTVTLPVTGLNFLQRSFNNDVVGQIILESVEKITGKARITANGAFGVALTQDDNANALNVGDTVNVTVKYKTTKTDGALWIYDTTKTNNIVRIIGSYAPEAFTPDESGYMTITITTTITAAGTQTTDPEDSLYTLPVTGVNFLQRGFSTDAVGEIVVESVEKVN